MNHAEYVAAIQREALIDTLRTLEDGLRSRRQRIEDGAAECDRLAKEYGDAQRRLAQSQRDLTADLDAITALKEALR